jgi:hypothetical protein
VTTKKREERVVESRRWDIWLIRVRRSSKRYTSRTVGNWELVWGGPRNRDGTWLAPSSTLFSKLLDFFSSLQPFAIQSLPPNMESPKLSPLIQTLEKLVASRFKARCRYISHFLCESFRLCIVFSAFPSARLLLFLSASWLHIFQSTSALTRLSSQYL